VNWLDKTAEQIKTGTDEKGTRLVLAFQSDYKKIFGQGAECCHTCPSFTAKVQKYKQTITKMKEVDNSGFKLKAKYEGIQVPFGSKPVSNVNLTDAKAKEIIKNHPKGVELFDKLPEGFEVESENEPTFEELVNNMKKDDLVAKAEELNIDASGNVKELKARIIENGEDPKQTEPEE
jgi:hypothetical protein